MLIPLVSWKKNITNRMMSQIPRKYISPQNSPENSPEIYRQSQVYSSDRREAGIPIGVSLPLILTFLAAAPGRRADGAITLGIQLRLAGTLRPG